MDLLLQNRRFCIIGDNSDIARACDIAFAAEGAIRIVTNDVDSDEIENADVVVIIEKTFPMLASEQLDAQQLIDAWADIETMAAVYRRALAHMQQQRWGRLIYVGSLAAKEISGRADAMTRAVGLGALGLQKTLSGEMGPFGITCNSVLWSANYLRGDTRAAGLTAIGATVVFLASDGAAYLTGVTMTVDNAQGAGMF